MRLFGIQAIQRRRIEPGHHVGIWREGRWIIVDLWRWRFELVR
jgi:hypothetical protein